jgi:glycosyltransferase involved in cell wall biosynthesis
MAEALARYASDPALRVRHGAAARARIESHYSVDAMLQAYLGLYHALLKSKPNLKEKITPCAES